MSFKKILKKIRCNFFCCFKSSCSYDGNGVIDIDIDLKEKKNIK